MVTLEKLIKTIPEDRRQAVSELRKVVLDNLPKGFSETIIGKMICYVVPHSIYPSGYHCDPKQPLPFISIASQKNYIALYHMGIYADNELLKWFTDQYPMHIKSRPDMGKGCIRFKKLDQIPFILIGELCSKMNCKKWINIYETKIKR